MVKVCHWGHAVADDEFSGHLTGLKWIVFCSCILPVSCANPGLAIAFVFSKISTVLAGVFFLSLILSLSI